MNKLKISILGLISLVIAMPIYLFGASYAMSWFSPNGRPQNPVRQSERVSASLASIQSFNDKLIAAGINPVEPASYIGEMSNTDSQTNSPATARTSHFVRAESNRESILAQSEDSTPILESTRTPSRTISAVSNSQPTISAGVAQESPLSSSELSATTTSSNSSDTNTTSLPSSDSSEVSSSLSSTMTSESSNIEESSDTANDLTNSDATSDTDISVVKNF